MNNGNINILFGGQIFVQAVENSLRKTGIYFVALNLLKALIKRKEVNVFLYIPYSFLEKRRNLLNLIGISDIKILTENDDLSEINSYFSPLEVVEQYIKKYPQISCYTVLHDMIPFINHDTFKDNPNALIFLNGLFKSLNNIDYYFSNSNYTKSDFLNYTNINSQNIRTILLSTNLKYSPNKDIKYLKNINHKYNIPENKKYLFSLCTLQARKNLIRAVKTFIEFIEKHNIDDLVYVLGGGAWGGFIEKLEKEVPEYEKYKDKIIRAGYVDDEDLEVLYSNAEWFVYTSQYEGFGMPPLEAMACGCPVITSNNSSLPEVVGDSGIMIDWDSDEQHIQAYEKYYFDNEYREQMAQKGLERSKLFSWDKAVDIILDKMYEVEERKKQKPLVTIITATYNLIKNGRKDWFIQNLESVQNQTYKNIEHIVIDGASTDGTIEVLEEYQNKGWIKYYSEPDKGIYDALNKGILKANGKYVVCLNSDDFYCDVHAVEWLVMKAEETGADACCASAKRVKFDSLELMNYWLVKDNLKPIFNMFPCHQTFLIKTEVMKELGSYDSNLKVSADNVFFIKMIQNNKTLVYINNIIIAFRDGGFSNSNIGLSLREREEGFFREYGQYHKLTRYDIYQLIRQRFLKLSIENSIKLGSKLCYTNNPEWIEQYFTILINHIQNQNKNKKIEINSKMAIKYLLQKIFSIRNEQNEKKKYKIITIFGIKVKLKIKDND